MNSSFKTIPGFTNYKISRSGRIYSKITNKILKAATTKKKYKRVCLLNDLGKRVMKFVHRLVALVFIPNP